MSTQDPMADATQRLQRAMADLRAKTAGGAPMAGADEREELTTTVTGSQVDVHSKRAWFPGPRTGTGSLRPSNKP